VVFEPDSSDCFPFQLWIFHTDMTHTAKSFRGKETVSGEA
jgi:hypothetical protein